MKNRTHLTTDPVPTLTTKKCKPSRTEGNSG
nr:MAG TPA: hypothetical protein [Caudoviricetes sp.]